MINKNELRIGNLFQCKIRPNEGEVVLKVLELYEWGILHFKNKEIGDIDSPKYGLANVHEVRSEVPYSAASGIPLTPPILEKCGLLYYEDQPIWQLNGFAITKPNDAGECDLIFQNSDHLWDITGYSIKYLHQLQNLFYSLCGEELQIQL